MDFQVRVGSGYNNQGGELFNVLEVIIHPRFYLRTFDFDVAVVILNENIMKSNTTKPIALSDDSWQLHVHEKAIVSGFGEPHVSHEQTLAYSSFKFRLKWLHLKEDRNITLPLMKVHVPIISLYECLLAYGHEMTNRMFCAGILGGDKDACHGDPGGPLALNGTLYGIVSWGDSCSDKTGVYTDVFLMKSWIRRQLRNNPVKQPRLIDTSV